MSADLLISRFQGVRQTGHRSWAALCPAHGDKRPSLAFRELDDGVVLLHCFAQCRTEDVLAAIGLTFEALFPIRRAGLYGARPRRPFFPAADVLRCIAFEATVVAIAASTLASGDPLAEQDRLRLLVAASRLNAAVRESGHG